MAKGKTKGVRFDLMDNYDPRIAGAAAQKGTIFRYIPAVGDPEILIKQDNGLSTNWINLAASAQPITTVVAASVANVDVANAPANIDGIALVDGDLVLLKDQTLPEENGVYQFSAAGDPLVRASGWNTAEEFIPGKQVFSDGGTVNADKMWVNADYVTVLGTDPVVFLPVSAEVVGLANTLAYFDAGGAIASDAQAAFFEATMSMFFGIAVGGGAFISNGNGALARGTSSGAGSSIEAIEAGAHAMGRTQTNGQLQAEGIGALAGGDVLTGFIRAMGYGSIAMGTVADNAIISSRGDGSLCMGVSTGNSQPDAIRADGNGSHAHGSSGGGTIVTGGDGSHASGVTDADASTSIDASGEGSHARGKASTGGYISANVNGSTAAGVADGADSVIQSSTGVAGLAHGHAQAAGWVNATGNGAVAMGSANTGRVTASGVGSMAVGSTKDGDATTLLRATGEGSFAFGLSESVGSIIQATSSGTFAHGRTQNGGLIQAVQIGAFAGGAAAVANAVISASGAGSFAHGHSSGVSSVIIAEGAGSIALGRADTACEIRASGAGAFAGGYAATSHVQTTGDGSFLYGDNITVTSNYSQTFGVGQDNSSYGCMVIGQFAPSTAYTPGAWVSTDPAFVIGNGANSGARSSAFEVRKDGVMSSFGGFRRMNPQIVVTNNDTVDVTKSICIVYVDLAKPGPLDPTDLNLPQGVDGMEVWIKGYSDDPAPTAINLIPFAGDVIDDPSQITGNGGAGYVGSKLLYFYDGKWLVLTFA